MTGVSGLADVLNKTLDGLGISPKARKYRVFSLWGEIVGDISRHARPRRLQGDVLFVATASSVWSQELTFMKESIVARINQALGGEYVKEVRFSEHLWGAQDDGRPRRGASRAPGRQGGDAGPEPLQDSPREALHAEGLGAEIDDVALFHAFRKTAGAMTRRRRYLLANGFNLCKTCGNVYPREKTECPACKVKREFTAYNRAIAILDRRPYLGCQELSKLADLPDLYLVEHARRELESRLVSGIRYRLGGYPRGDSAAYSDRQRGPRSAAEKAANRSELTSLARKLASLRSQAPFESLCPEDIEKAVGRRLSTLLKKE